MYDFAKVFESNGREVLIMKGKTVDSEGVETPRLSIITHFDCGKQLDAGMVLQGGTFEDLDKLFDAAGQDTADSVTEFITPGMTPYDYLMGLKAEVAQCGGCQCWGDKPVFEDGICNVCGRTPEQVVQAKFEEGD